MEDYKKAFSAIRHWLLGRSWHTALQALEYAQNFHPGLRKDGVTPSFQHQLSIIYYIRTLENHLTHPENTIAVSCLHDTPEDADVGFAEITSLFGDQISKSVKLLTKKHRGSKKQPEAYYGEIATDDIASIVKGADRVNNIQTMIGVFTKEKQVDYIRETTDLVLPMLKTSRRAFSRQEPAYQNIKIMLQNQIALIEEIHRTL